MSKILVVDDETSMRELLYDVFRRKGFEVYTATSGAHAMEMLRAHRPDVILLDSHMPNLSGHETAKQIRSFEANTPIILMKAPGDADGDSPWLAGLGIKHVIHKELSVELFLKELELVVRQESQERVKANGAAPRVPGSILIVDDEPSITKMLKAFLESRGMRVVVASSGEEAITAAAKHSPQIIVLDINMPGMDGLMTLKRLRETKPKVPVIVASGFGDEDTVRKALDSGAYDYITKPFNLEYLETMVLTKVLLGMDGADQ